MTDEASLNPAIAEAAKKAQIAWVAVGSAPASCLWCLWIDEALYLVCGPGEQSDPGLADASECRVTLRGDHNGRIVDFTAAVTRITPETEAWVDTAAALSTKRLNAGAGDTADRWARDCALYRLTPGPDARTGTALPADSLAAPVVESPAARPTRKPFRLHKVKPKSKRR